MMPAPDSRRFANLLQPASFRFWAIASAIVAVIGVLCLFIPSGGTPAETASDGPGVVINLQDPPAKTHQSGEPGHGEPGAAPPQSVDVTNALVAADGTIVIEPALLAPGPDGPLPVVAPDGRKAMHVYAARFDPADTRPRASIVITGLGLSEQITQQAIDRLPPGSTLAFSPYGQNLQNWVASARAKGHEVLLEVPMEPFDFPNDDPGAHTLLTGAQDNAAKLNWLLGRFSGYAGVVNAQGGKFLASPDDLRPLLTQVVQRGLFMAETGLSQRSVGESLAGQVQAPYVKTTMQIDKVPGPDEMDAALEQLTNAAIERRAAIASATASPGVIDRIAQWAPGLEDRGVVYAPVSAALPFAGKTGP